MRVSELFEATKKQKDDAWAQAQDVIKRIKMVARHGPPLKAPRAKTAPKASPKKRDPDAPLQFIFFPDLLDVLTDIGEPIEKIETLESLIRAKLEEQGERDYSMVEVQDIYDAMRGMSRDHDWKLSPKELFQKLGLM